jgi:hypothetical protein
VQGSEGRSILRFIGEGAGCAQRGRWELERVVAGVKGLELQGRGCRGDGGLRGRAGVAVGGDKRAGAGIGMVRMMGMSLHVPVHLPRLQRGVGWIG